MDPENPKPSVGRIVMHRTRDTNRKYNGRTDHPAIVTAVWNERCINVKVLPDCGDCYDACSQSIIDPGNQTAQGWFWPPRE